MERFVVTIAAMRTEKFISQMILLFHFVESLLRSRGDLALEALESLALDPTARSFAQEGPSPA